MKVMVWYFVSDSHKDMMCSLSCCDRDVSALYRYVLETTFTTPCLICNWIGFSMDLVSSSQYGLFWVQVLRWLKQWDLCVFGAKQSSTSGEVQASLRRHVSQKQGRAPRGGPFSYSRPSNWSHSPGSNGTNRQSYKSSSDTFLKSEPAKGSPLSEQSVKDKPEERVAA